MHFNRDLQEIYAEAGKPLPFLGSDVIPITRTDSADPNDSSNREDFAIGAEHRKASDLQNVCKKFQIETEALMSRLTGVNNPLGPEIQSDLKPNQDPDSFSPEDARKLVDLIPASTGRLFES